MSGQERNKKFKTANVISYIIFITGGFAMGFLIVKLVEDMNNKSELAGLLIAFVFLLVAMIVIMFLHIIIHEVGHLICGLISGYKFVSFRIGSLMLKKEKGKFVFKKFKIPGTAGQCLMMPDENWNAYDYPYTLYNLGGILANIMVALISLGLYLSFSNTIFLREILIILFVYGTILALNNAIPMKIGGVANDGQNILALNKNRDARRALYLQLYINGLQSEGTRLKDMSEEYFELPPNADLTNPLIVSIGVFKSDYLQDKMEFIKAKENSLYLIENAPGLLGVHKNELTCELLFYELIGSCREDEINRLYTDELKKHIKGTLSYLSRRRLIYTYEIFVNHDKEAAKRELEEFEKATKNYPFPSIIEVERELIEFIDNLVVVKNIEMS